MTPVGEVCRRNHIYGRSAVTRLSETLFSMPSPNSKLSVLLQTSRPAFLILTPVCIFLGISTSLATQSSISYFLVALILTGALSAHISVNMLNEYFDFKSGLDFKTQKTPFSGGSGALPSNPQLAGLVLKAGLIFLVVTVIIGIYLSLERSVQILPIGLLGVTLLTTYTPWLNRSPTLCLVTPGLGFGVLMVVGTHVILTGQHAALPWLVSLPPFFLINNLLLLNQYPDMAADASVGRKTFPIAFGLKTSTRVYAIFLLAGGLCILLLIAAQVLPSQSLIALTPLSLALLSLIGAVKYSYTPAHRPRYMAANVAAAILTPLVLGISIIVYLRFAG